VLNLSKAKKLGVIILAAKYLASLNLPFPRLISAAARLLGVSRKAGYQAARQIEEELGDRPAKAPAEERRDRELFLLRIQNQVLRYERDHGDVRFAARGPHLPEDAKSLCVRILRDLEGKLSLSDIANAIGVATSSLSRWDTEADEECRFPVKPERRGSSRHATPQEAQQVVEAFKSLQEDMILEEFVDHYNTLHDDAPLDRRTITRILQAAGLYAPEPRTDRKDYHGKFTVYFPGAQAAVDGKQTTVRFTGEPEESVTVLKEVAVDIASGTIVGDALTPHENAKGVRRVVVKARKECASLLAVLADNRSSNTAAEARWAMEEHSELGPIFTFPYHARTNGHLEGLFGQFSRIVGSLEIDDRSRERLAESIVEVVWRVFIHFHNHSPRKRLDGKSPLDYLKTYTVLPREVEAARTGLGAQKQRSQRSRAPHPRLSDPVFRALVNRILTEHGFGDVEFDHALESLVAFDTAVIESASCAFSAYGKRDGFQESKRHFAYFMGIVRNKQQAVDQDHRNAAADVLRAQRLIDKNAAADQGLEEEQRQERHELTTQPEAVVLRYAQLLMQGRFRWLRETCLRHIREGLRALSRLGRTSTQILESLAVTIRGQPHFAEDIKDRMVSVLSEELEQLVGS
jgi:transposase-like protein